MKLVNNLVNITNSDPIYKVKQAQLWDILANQLQQVKYADLVKVPDISQQIQLIATDSYFMHYSIVPILRDKNSDQLLNSALQFFKQYTNSQKYQQIRLLTQYDDELSKVYSISLTKEILKKLKEEIEKELEKRQQDPQFQQLPQDQQLQQAFTYVISNQKIMNQVFQHAVKAAEKATRNYKELRDFLGVSAGKDPGTFEKTLNLAEKIRKVEYADRILAMGNQLVSSMPVFTHIKKTLDKHGEELAGYRLTKKLSEALPRELALPDELFYMKLAGNGFLAKQKLSIREGAYYVLLDKSGSMDGEKTVWARSVALALLKLAKMKRRKFFLRFFDEKVWQLKTSDNIGDLVEHLLTIKSDGGTNIDRAISTAISDLKQAKLSEQTNTIILITDGEDHVKDWTKELKQANAKLISVMVQGHNETLEKISDQYLKAELNEKGALEVIEYAK